MMAAGPWAVFPHRTAALVTDRGILDLTAVRSRGGWPPAVAAPRGDGMADPMPAPRCWCGVALGEAIGDYYRLCPACGTAALAVRPDTEVRRAKADADRAARLGQIETLTSALREVESGWVAQLVESTRLRARLEAVRQSWVWRAFSRLLNRHGDGDP